MTQSPTNQQTNNPQAAGAAQASAVLQPVAHIQRPQERHWVGDGFHVSTMFSPYQIDPQILSPFVLMDYAAPKHFEPAERPKGVGEHPHRGFETVTFAYQGEVTHRDSAGGGGTIGTGDVQWMTAGKGVVHEEFHSQAFTQVGGTFEMVQLWVNLPARLKMTQPRYQSLSGSSFAQVSLGDATARLIAGALFDGQGPAQTHSPINIFDLSIPAGAEAAFELPKGYTTLLFNMKGEAHLQNEHQLESSQLAIMDRQRPGSIRIKAQSETRLLVLNGEPFDEPVVAHGPFVMNTKEEIVQAMRDYQQGKMGNLPQVVR